MMSEMTIAVIVVSGSCHHLTRADSGWSRMSWFSRVTLPWLRGGTSVAPWRHKCRTCQFFRRLFDRLPVRISTSDLHHRILRKKLYHIRAYDFGAQVQFSFKPGLQYTQETSAKPRDFARTQAKKCLQSMRVCLQNFHVCVTSQLVAQTTTEFDHSFTVEFTTHKCTSTEENKMALACKKEGRIGFSFFVRCFVCASFFPLLLFSSFSANSYCRENHWKTSTHAIFGFQNKIRSG